MDFLGVFTYIKSPHIAKYYPRITGLSIEEYAGPAVLYLTLYMDFRGIFWSFSPHLVVNVKLLTQGAQGAGRRFREKSRER
jgi:hypothetical protein